MAAGQQTVQVLLVDDHAVLAGALSAVISNQPDLQVCGVQHSIFDLRAEIALCGSADTCPDVVILDVRFPDGNGISEIAFLKERCPSSAVLVLTASTALDVLAAAVRAGADGFMTKTEPTNQLLDAVRSVNRGDTVFDAADLTRLSRYLVSGNTMEVDPLTPRERQVLLRLAKARSTAQIADELVISQHTVRNHVRSLLDKLGAQSKLEAVLTAIRRGIICLD